MKKNYPEKVFTGVMVCIFILLVLNILSYLDFYYNNLDERAYFFRKTNFNLERNAPTIFASSLHFAASILLAIVAFSKLSIKKIKSFWIFLSILILFIGLDELLVIHEKVGRAFSENVETSGIFFFAWVVPYGIALVLIGLVLLKSLLKLPKKTRLNFIMAGAIFVSGAMGIEMFTGWYVEYNQLQNENLLRVPDTFILSTFEELFEMIGIGFFVYSILDFIREYRIKT